MNIAEQLTMIQKKLYEDGIPNNTIENVLHITSRRRFGMPNPGRIGYLNLPLSNLAMSLYIEHKEELMNVDMFYVREWLFSQIIPEQVEILNTGEVYKVGSLKTRDVVKEALIKTKAGEFDKYKKPFKIEDGEEWKLWLTMLY